MKDVQVSSVMRFSLMALALSFLKNELPKGLLGMLLRLVFAGAAAKAGAVYAVEAACAWNSFTALQSSPTANMHYNIMQWLNSQARTQTQPQSASQQCIIT